MEVMHSNICAYLPQTKMEGRLRLNSGKRNRDWSGCLAHIKVLLQMLKEKMQRMGGQRGRELDF